MAKDPLALFALENPTSIRMYLYFSKAIFDEEFFYDNTIGQKIIAL